MRTAFFGGSFDPPHLGHLRIAQAAADRLSLDCVLLAPVALQPLKRDALVPASASWTDRLAMLHLLLLDASDPRLEVSELDAPRPDGQPNYTCDTVALLRTQRPHAGQLFLLLGADSFLTMHHWHRAAELLLSVDWILAARPGFDLHSLQNPLQRLDRALPPSIHPAPGPVRRHADYLQQRLEGPHGCHRELYVLADLREDISATEIRAAYAEGCEVQHVLAPSVVEYIRSHHLYR